MRAPDAVTRPLSGILGFPAKGYQPPHLAATVATKSSAGPGWRSHRRVHRHRRPSARTPLQNPLGRGDGTTAKEENVHAFPHFRDPVVMSGDVPPSAADPRHGAKGD